MPLNIEKNQSSQHTLKLSLSGSLNSDTAQMLDDFLNDHLSDTIKVVALNMHGLTFISSAGLRVIFKALKLVKSRGGQLSVTQMSKGVRKVFEIVKVMPDLTVFGSQSEMDQYLAEIQRRENHQ